MSFDSDNSNNDEDFQLEVNTSTDDSEYNQTRPNLFAQFTTKCSIIRKKRNSSIKKSSNNCFSSI